MLVRFAANIRAGFSIIARLTTAKVAVGAIVAACFVTPQGWRLLVAIVALGLLFAAVGAFLGLELDAGKKEDADAFADPS